MRPFDYRSAADPAAAARMGSSAAEPAYLAGGTTLVDLMKLDVMRPKTVIDINGLAPDWGKVEADSQGLRLGALARMSDVAADPVVRRDYPAIAQSLDLAASAQLRNMASLGGNVLQRTRCTYFRDVSWKACNKRTPGSGCAALEGVNRTHAVLGVSASCIATYPGDLAVALIALDATVSLVGPDGARSMAFADLHREPKDKPQVETNLRPGELIVGFSVPAGLWTRRSVYTKVRDRQSYEFALASAAVALEMDGDTVRSARVALGGVATKPWRAREAESVLAGARLTEDVAQKAGRAAFAGAVTHGGNDYKPRLGAATVARALLEAQALEIAA
jgi:xanthine dehydrogenase YagS FAD-binding subunit